MSLGFVQGTGRNIPDPVLVSFRSFFVFIALKSCQTGSNLDTSGKVIASLIVLPTLPPLAMS